MNICYIFAMEAEAQPLIKQLKAEEQEQFFAPLPCRLFEATLPPHPSTSNLPPSPTGRAGVGLYIVTNGRQHDRDLIGCEAAALTTAVAIQRLKPDLVISSGTCGGWARKGAKVGEVYIANGAMFHDRRVPGDNAWDTQGLGNYPVWEGSYRLAERLQMPMGKVTTGSSFDLQPIEEQYIDANGGQLKEMEGAAVAFACSLFRVPVMLVKAVTNLRDLPSDDITDFQTHLAKVSQQLCEANINILREIQDRNTIIK